MKVVVKKGHTVEYGDPIEKDGKIVGVEKHRAGPGTELDFPKPEADRLIALGAVVLPKTDEAAVAQLAARELPADFPGLGALRKAGIGTYDDVASRLEAITDIEGIGAATAKKIAEALREHV